jgi:hypothetical protein
VLINVFFVRQINLFLLSNPPKMATADLNKLQQLLQGAEDNEMVLTQVRKNMEKLTALISETNALLDPSYTPERKERKPRAANASGTGGRRGRPRKEASAE